MGRFDAWLMIHAPPHAIFADENEKIAKRRSQDHAIDEVLDGRGAVPDFSGRHVAQRATNSGIVAPDAAKAADGGDRRVFLVAGEGRITLTPHIRERCPAAVVGQDVDQIRVAAPEHLSTLKGRISGADGRRAGVDGAAEQLDIPGVGQAGLNGNLAGSGGWLYQRSWSNGNNHDWSRECRRIEWLIGRRY